MKRGRTLCSIEAVNGFQVCLWNESECFLAYLVPSKYLSKNNSTQGNHYWPPPFLTSLTSSWCLGKKLTHLESIQGKAYRGPVYIEQPAELLVPFTAAQRGPLCPVHWPQTWHAWPSLSSSSSASPCFTSATAVRLAPGRLFHLASLEVIV